MFRTLGLVPTSIFQKERALFLGGGRARAMPPIALRRAFRQVLLSFHTSLMSLMAGGSMRAYVQQGEADFAATGCSTVKFLARQSATVRKKLWLKTRRNHHCIAFGGRVISESV
tara:strand:- start:782 stop:1123 length:342 start_codon:yes stop_codon:yes gene_type:complete